MMADMRIICMNEDEGTQEVELIVGGERLLTCTIGIVNQEFSAWDVKFVSQDMIEDCLALEAAENGL